MRTLIALFVLALALLLSDLLTVQRMDVCPTEQLPTLYGFPLPYRTSIPWVNSMSGVLFALGLVIDLVCYTLLLAALRKAALRWLPPSLLQARWSTFLYRGVLIVSILLIAFFVFAVEWRWEPEPDLVFDCPEWQWTTGAFLD
jgi:hypothetical protein